MEYILIRSDRKTVSMEIAPDLSVVVRAPRRMPARQIDKFVTEHEAWAIEHIERRRKMPAVSDEDKAELRARAKAILPQMVAYYSDLMQLYPTGVKITSAEKRFGSCSANNSLCFSWRLMAYPQRTIEYVVVHELAHIRHKDHGRDFYNLIEKYMPDYKERIKLLRGK